MSAATVSLLFCLVSGVPSFSQTVSAEKKAGVPLGFTLYSKATQPSTWHAADEVRGNCVEMLQQGKAYFQSVTLQVDFDEWHRGDVSGRASRPDRFSPNDMLYVTPATPAYLDEVVRCMVKAREMGFRPIVLKIKIIDYSWKDFLGITHAVWRANIPFDPLRGTYFYGKLSPVDFGIEAVRRYSAKAQDSTCDGIVLSVNDEYTKSVLTHPDQWKQVYDYIKDQLGDRKVRLAANLDWMLPYHYLATLPAKKEAFTKFLSGLSLVGWSLYRPYGGFTPEFVKYEQKKSVMDLRSFLDGIGLSTIPMAILEYGVTMRVMPSAWNPKMLSREDQRRAYRAWLELLSEPDIPLDGVFSFWFGMLDPRATVAADLLKYMEEMLKRQATCAETRP